MDGGGRGGWGKPIVLDLDGDGVEIALQTGSRTHIDFDDDGFLERSAWAVPDDGILVIDLAEDGTAGADGKISRTREIALALWDEDADTDLEGLKLGFDSGDGVFDDRDDRFDEFRVWRDADSDGVADEGELRTLEEAGIRSIDPASDGERLVLPDGTIVHGEIAFRKTDGETGKGADVAFRHGGIGYRIVETDDGFPIETERGGDKNYYIHRTDTAADIDLEARDYVGAFGNGRNDRFDARALATDVVLAGGGGNDILFVDSDDTMAIADIDGGAGYDQIFFTDDLTLDLTVDDLNVESVRAGGGDDRLTGANDDINYTLFGGDGNDTIVTAGDDDILSGGAGDDVIDAGNGENTILGDDGDDAITTGDGDDFVSGGDGADNLDTGAGNDILIVDGSDTYDAGDGIDRIVYEGDEDLDVNITDHNAEIFHAGGGNDTIATDQRSAAAIYGGAGDDTISGGWGADYLSGDAGDDTLDGGYGSDVYLFGRGFGQDIITDEYVHQSSYKTWVSRTVGRGEDQRREWHQVSRDASKEYNAGDNDTVRFGARITLADLLLRRDGDNLEIAIKDPDSPDASFDELADRVTLANWETENREIETLRFADGTEVRLKDLTSAYGLSSENLVVSDLSIAMNASAPDADTDAMIGGTNGNDTLGGTTGTETLHGGAGDDVLLGSRGRGCAGRV